MLKTCYLLVSLKKRSAPLISCKSTQGRDILVQSKERSREKTKKIFNPRGGSEDRSKEGHFLAQY